MILATSFTRRTYSFAPISMSFGFQPKFLQPQWQNSRLIFQNNKSEIRFIDLKMQYNIYEDVLKLFK
jgi:hypothetical protein